MAEKAGLPADDFIRRYIQYEKTMRVKDGGAG
jgi:hypothetical protein